MTTAELMVGQGAQVGYRGRVILIALGIAVAVLLAESMLGRLVAIVLVLGLSVWWPVDRLVVAVMVMFVAADDRASTPYADLWTSPVQHVANFWFHTIKTSVPFAPIPLAPMAIVPAIMLVRAATNRTGPRMERTMVTPIVPGFGKLLLGAICAIPIMMAWGYVRGGSVQQMYYQTFGVVIALSMCGAVARVATPGLARLVFRLIVILAIYRALVAIYIYLTIARHLAGEPPLYLTSHYDSVLWVIALVWVIATFVERDDRSSFWLATRGQSPARPGNRGQQSTSRLGHRSWRNCLSSVTATKSVRSVCVRSQSWRSRSWFSTWLSDLSRPSRGYSHPFSRSKSVVTGDDRSSQTHDIENYNLVSTMRFNFPASLGYGNPYIESVVGDDISVAFPQYRHLPHNSLLGMFMLVGPVGVALLLSPLVFGVACSHWLRRFRPISGDVQVQTTAIMAVWIGFLVGAWGDLGLFTTLPSALVGVASGLGVGLLGWYSVASTGQKLQS